MAGPPFTNTNQEPFRRIHGLVVPVCCLGDFKAWGCVTCIRYLGTLYCKDSLQECTLLLVGSRKAHGMPRLDTGVNGFCLTSLINQANAGSRLQTHKPDAGRQGRVAVRLDNPCIIRRSAPFLKQKSLEFACEAQPARLDASTVVCSNTLAYNIAGTITILLNRGSQTTAMSH